MGFNWAFKVLNNTDTAMRILDFVSLFCRKQLGVIVFMFIIIIIIIIIYF